VTDPDADVERRVVRAVELTISDVLSQIVNNAIQSSLKDIIVIAD
jgi:hypothetical protein